MISRRVLLLGIFIIILGSIAYGDTGRFDLVKKQVLTLCDEDSAGASSTLPSKKDPFRYEPNKMFDGDIKTAWAEGSPGSGNGVRVVFAIPTSGHAAGGAGYMNIVNGYASSKKLFAANNRIKEFTLEIYVGIDKGVDEDYCSKYALKKHSEKTYTLKDTMEKQSVKLDLDFKALKDFWRKNRDDMLLKDKSVFGGEYGRYLFGVLTIKSVYKGSKYDDTCISEISFK